MCASWLSHCVQECAHDGRLALIGCKGGSQMFLSFILPFSTFLHHHIVTWQSDYTWGLDWRLDLLTITHNSWLTLNYSTITDLHTLQITTAHTKSWNHLFFLNGSHCMLCLPQHHRHHIGFAMSLCLQQQFSFSSSSRVIYFLVFKVPHSYKLHLTSESFLSPWCFPMVSAQLPICPPMGSSRCYGWVDSSHCPYMQAQVQSPDECTPMQCLLQGPDGIDMLTVVWPLVWLCYFDVTANWQLCCNLPQVPWSLVGLHVYV
jgi:hypothetical protein